MTTTRFFVAAAVAGGLCFAGGFAIAKISRPDLITIGDGASAASTVANQSNRLTAITPGGGGAGASRQLAKLTQSTDIGFYARMCGYLNLVTKAEVAEIPDLMASVTRNVSDDLGKDALLNVLAKRWAELDPQGAYQALLDGEPEGLGRATGEILMSMAKTEPRGAWQKLLDADVNNAGVLGNAKTREEFIRSVISAIGAEDASIAAELMGAVENTAKFSASFGNAHVYIASSNPEGFLENIDRLSFSSLHSRASAISAALRGLEGKSPGAILARLGTLEGLERRRAELALAVAWGQRDPQAAMEWADGLIGTTRNQSQAHILGLMAVKDPVAAAAALSKIDSPTGRSTVAGSVAVRWWEDDPEGSIAWVREDLEGQAQRVAYGSLFEKQLGKSDFDENFEFFKEMAEAAPVSQLHSRFVSAWAMRDPQAAAEWAIERTEFSDGGELLQRVAVKWASSDPAGLERFRATLSSEDMKETIAGELKKNRTDNEDRGGKKE